jgi:hypothetical protein
MAQSTPKKGRFYSDLKRNKAGDTFTRSQAGKMLNPPVSERQIRRYLGILKMFHPDFSVFKNEETWGLNGLKIERKHLIELQQIRQMFIELRSQSKVQLEYRRLYHDHSS